MLERKDKLSLLLLSITSFFGSLLELMALTSVLPFISLIFNEKLIKENNSLNFRKAKNNKTSTNNKTSMC